MVVTTRRIFCLTRNSNAEEANFLIPSKGKNYTPAQSGTLMRLFSLSKIRATTMPLIRQTVLMIPEEILETKLAYGIIGSVAATTIPIIAWEIVE